MMLLAGLASSCASSKSQAEILRMIADAKTPADHEAIAEYYDRQASEAAESAQFYEAMAHRYHQPAGQSYRSMQGHPRWGTPEHCIKIARYYEDVEAQDSELAAAHRALAQQKQ